MVASSCISDLNSTQRICKFIFPHIRSNELSTQSMHYYSHPQSHTQCPKLHSVSYPIAAKLFPSVDLFFAISSLKSVAATVVRFPLTHDSKNDLRWWLQFLTSWSSISMIQLSRISFDVATEASGA